MKPIEDCKMLADFEAIGLEYGSELYPKLDNGHKAVIAYGMFPADIMVEAEVFFRKVVADAFNKRHDNLFDPVALRLIIRIEIVEAFRHGVTLGILNAADKAGNLLV